MSVAEQYRKLAINLTAIAEREKSDHLKAGWEGLARGYIHLAKQAETGAALAVTENTAPFSENPA